MSFATRSAVLAGTTALFLVGTMAAYAAGTDSSEPVNCGWGQTGSADFTENNTSATWEYWGTWEIKHWYGNETKDGPHSTYVASRGKHRITSESSSKQKLDTIHVHSSGSVQSAGGRQCADAANYVGFDAGDTAIDDVLLPPLSVPAPCLDCTG